MSSPFPGMDPFLEDPTEWGGVHSRLINSTSDVLADIVSPHFFVKIIECPPLPFPCARPSRIFPWIYRLPSTTSMPAATTLRARTIPENHRYPASGRPILYGWRNAFSSGYQLTERKRLADSSAYRPKRKGVVRTPKTVT